MDRRPRGGSLRRPRTPNGEGGDQAGGGDPEKRHQATWDDPAPGPMLRSLPPEYRPYVRRVAMLIVLAAVLGVILGLVIPGGHH